MFPLLPTPIHRSLTPLQPRINPGHMQSAGHALELRVSGNRACFYSLRNSLLYASGTRSLPAKTQFSPRPMQFYTDPGSQFTLRDLDFGVPGSNILPSCRAMGITASSTPHPDVVKPSQCFRSDLGSFHIHPLLSLTSLERKGVSASFATKRLGDSLGPKANLLSPHLHIYVLVMNPPPQIGSRVRWWDSRGQLKHGHVKAINVLTDSSHVIVIQVEDGQPSTVTLPLILGRQSRIDHVQLA
ncbi:hypothetical protein BJY52DRAFT_1183104 [Lactarius psammicola]|nr:hypothetical protein BJY52DRAFT_1183104 [Lactarius psammicola]